MACASLASGVVFANAIHAIPVYFTLEPEQLAYAAKLGCRDPHGLELDNATGFSWNERNPDDMLVSGECVSHRAVAGYPVKYLIDCSHKKGEWSCNEDQEKLFAEVNGKRAQIQTAVSEVSLELAFNIVVYLESLDAWEPRISDSLDEGGPLYEYFKVVSIKGDVVTLYVQTSGDREIRVIHSAGGDTFNLVR